MLVQSIDVLPINLLQIAFLTLTGLGALLIWNVKIYRGLAIFFIYQSVLMLLNFLEETQITRSDYLITPVFTLAVGPLLYFVVRALVNEKAWSVRKKCAHFLPVVLTLPFTEFTQSVIALGILSQLFYLAAAFRLLNRYHIATMSVRSDADSIPAKTDRYLSTEVRKQAFIRSKSRYRTLTTSFYSMICLYNVRP